MLIVIGILTILFMTGIFIVSRVKIDATLGALLAVSFSIRLIAALFQELYQLAPYAWDEALFMNMGIKIKHFFDGARASLPFETLTGVPAYGFILGVLFYLFDIHPILPRLLSVVLGTGVVYWVWMISTEVKLKESYRTLVCLIVGFTPSYVLYSTLIMRDMLIWLLTMVMVFFWVQAIDRLSIRRFTLGMIPALLLVPLRPQYAPLFVVAIGFIAFLFAKRTDFQLKNIRLPGLQYWIFFCSFSALILFGGLLVISEISRWDNATVMEYLISQQGWRAQGGSVYLSDLEYTSFFDVFIYLPQRFMHFTFGPFLWNGGSAQVFASGLESLIGWIFFFILIANYKILNRSLDSSWVQSIRFILMFVIINLITASIIDSNYGTAMRHRMIFMPLLFIAALSMRQTRIDLTSNS